MKPRFIRLPLAAALLALSAVSQAATSTWTPTTAGTTYSWDSASNWTSGFPNAIGDIANLNINLAGVQTINLNQAITVGTINLGDITTGFFGTTIAGNGGSLILDVASGSAAINKATASNTAIDTISADIQLYDNLSVTNAATAATGALTLSGIISESGGAKNLTKAGAGLLILSNANTYSGVSTLSAGTVNLGVAETAGVSGPLGMSAASNPGSIVLTGGTLQYSASNQNDYSGRFSAAASQQYKVDTNGRAVTWATALTSSVGTLTLNDTAATKGTLTLSGENSYTGVTTITAGTLSINSIQNKSVNSPLGAYAATGFGGLSIGAGTLKYTGGTATTDRGFTLSGAGTIDVNSAGTALTFGASGLGSTLNVTGGAGSSLSLGAVTLNAAAALNPTSATLAVASVTAVNVNLTLGGTATGNSVTGAINTGTGTLTKNGTGTWTLNGTNTFTGNTTVSAGILKLGNAAALQNSAYVTTGSNGTTIGVDVNGFSTLTLGGLSGTVNLASAIIGYSGVTGLALNPLSGSQTYSGIIANGGDAMTLTKSGGGTQILSGANTYTGATTVNAGLLRINSPGSLHASSAVSVSGGALGGTGTINGAVTLSGSGAIDLRDTAVGTLTLGGNLTINGTAGANRLYFDLGAAGAGADKITVAGNTTMSTSGAGVITLNQIGGSATPINPGTYTLIQGTGTIPALGDFTLATTKAYGQTFSLGVSDNNLQVTAVAGTAGGAATSWAGATDASWAAAGNWTSGGPGYSSVVTIYNTGAGNLSTTLDGDFDIKGLIYAADATSATTIAAGTGGGMLTIEGSGITVNTPTSGTVMHTIGANVGVAATQVWTVNPSATLTVEGNVTDFGGGYTLSKKGAGVLNLNGTTTVGSLYVGFNVASTAGSVVVGSGGTLSVGYGPSSMLLVGVNGWTAGLDQGTLDVSAANFTADVGNLYVGVCAPGLTSPASGNGLLKLGNSSVTATNVVIGGTDPDANSGATDGGTVTVASGTTATILTPVMRIGTSKGTTVTDSLKLLGTGATLNLGDSSKRTLLTIGSNTSGDMQNKTWAADMDLSAGTGNLYLSGLTLAVNGNNNAHLTGRLELGSASNILDISGTSSPVKIGYGSSPAYSTTATLTITNLASGSSINATDNSTAILVGYQGGTGPTTGTLNLNGGTLTITTTGSAIAGGGGTSNLVLGDTTGNGSGMTLKAGASSTAWITGLTSAKIKATGVTFDTDVNNITVAQNLLTDSVSTGGGLTKVGASTLTLSGANTYTGPTNVNAGTLVLNGANTGGGAVTVADNARLGGSGSTSAAVIVQAGGKLFANVTAWGAGTCSHLTVASLSLPATWAVNVTIDAFSEADKTFQFLTAAGGISGFIAPAVTGPGTGTWLVRQNASDAGILELVYTVGGLSPYATWAAGPFANAFTDTDPAHDPDGDGLSNQREFAFGLDPTTGKSCNPITSPLSKSTLTFSYTRYAASKLSYTVWTSTDLQGWTKVLPADMIENAGTPNTAGVAKVAVTLTSPTAGDKLFVRVQAE